MELIIFFSSSMNGFYDSRLINEYKASNTLPEDIIKMTDDEVATYYMVTPPAGKRLGTINNRPGWIDIPPPTHEEQVAIAEQKRQKLLIQANTITADWRTELALGIISDDDKSKLTAWMQYIKAVKVVDTSTAPDITWPETPAL